MKKLLRIPLFLAAMFFTTVPLSAHGFEVDGIYYNITDNTAKTVEVTYRDYSTTYTYSGNIIIPEIVLYNNSEYSVTAIGDHTFEDDDVYSVVVPPSVTKIGYSAFKDCNQLESITIPPSVTEIDSHAFENCYELQPIAIPPSVTEIGYSAFLNCYSLLDFNKLSISATQTSVTYKPQYSIIEYTYTPALMLYGSVYRHTTGELYYDDVIGCCEVNEKITGLIPCRKYPYTKGIIINGMYCPIYDDSHRLSITTAEILFNFDGQTTTTSLDVACTHSGDVTVLSYGINIESNTIDYNNISSISKTHLDPNTPYIIYYGVKIKESSSAYTTLTSFTTGALEWSAGEYQATSTTSVRLMTETTCDATAGTGIEWRRYGAPESLAPNKAECPVVDGMLVGFLKGLNPEAYYEYRPYYTSASGKTYYGEWAAFFSGDAGVYFEPEVRTFTESSVDGNSATIKGYALPGTDEVTGQGFEYWKANEISTYSTNNVKTVSASGISMSVTLSGLDYNSTYCYRAFVTTAKGTTYGDTVEFSTGYPAGIYTVEADNDENTASYRIMPGMLVVNGDGSTPVMVADMNGRMLYSGCATEYMELPLKVGIYILRLGSNAHKVVIR